MRGILIKAGNSLSHRKQPKSFGKMYQCSSLLESFLNQEPIQTYNFLLTFQYTQKEKKMVVYYSRKAGGVIYGHNVNTSCYALILKPKSHDCLFCLIKDIIETTVNTSHCSSTQARSSCETAIRGR